MTSEPARSRPREVPAGDGGTVVPIRRGETDAACPLAKCDGTGWLDAEDGTVEPCECRSVNRRSRARGLASTLPARYRGVSFDRPPLSDMARAPGSRTAATCVKTFSEDIDARLAEGEGFWLQGGVGIGKTSLAMYASKAAIEAGKTVAIYSLPRLLARIRQTFDSVDGEDTYSVFFDRLISVDLLHIDDLGAEKQSDWVLEQLYSIIDERYQAMRSVIVTSNLDSDSLEDEIGSRIVSRLREMCQELFINNDSDMRPPLTR